MTHDRQAGWCRGHRTGAWPPRSVIAVSEGKTGAGGDLLEDHAKALVAEQVRIITVNLNGLLHCKTKILDSQNLLFGELIGVDEIL